MTSVWRQRGLVLVLALFAGCSQREDGGGKRGAASATRQGQTRAALASSGAQAALASTGAPRVVPDPNPPTPFGEAVVLLVDPGEEPRLAMLPYPVGEGRSEIRGSVSTEVSTAVGGVPRSATGVPEVDFVAELDWEPAAAGGAAVIVRFRSVKARSPGEVPPEMRANFERAVAGVTKKPYYFEVAPDGEVSPPTQHGDAAVFGIPNGAAKLVLGPLSRALPVLIGDPVGVGGSWNVAHRYRSSDGLSVERSSAYRYDKRVGKRARVVLAGKDTGKLTAPWPGDAESPQSATSEAAIEAEYLVTPGSWPPASGSYTSTRATTKVAASGETQVIHERVHVTFATAR
jgi:hypothetical protein